MNTECSCMEHQRQREAFERGVEMGVPIAMGLAQEEFDRRFVAALRAKGDPAGADEWERRMAAQRKGDA